MLQYYIYQFMSNILQKLKGGDLRSIGKADEVVKDILKDPSIFDEVFQGILSDDPVIRMRCSDVIEKVSSMYPEYLKPYKNRLINEVAKINQQEVQWHVAQMFSYLDFSKSEMDVVIKILFSFIDSSKSNIVKVFSLQTLAEIGLKNELYWKKIFEKINEMAESESPAVVSRCKKLLKILNNNR